MTASLSIETSEKELPLLLLYSSGEQSLLTGFLEKTFIKHTQVVLAGGAKSTTQARIIEKSKTFLIKKLNEKIRYGIIIATKEQEKKYILEFLNKFENDNTRFTVIIPIDIIASFYDLIIELKRNKNGSVLLLGDIFGRHFQNTQLSKLIKSALFEKKILLSGDDLLPIYPISDTDMASAIHSILFGSGKKRKIYALYYGNPQTHLSFVHLLKRVEPELTISFNGKKGIVHRITRDKLEKELMSKVMQVPDMLDSELQGFEKSVRQMEDVSHEYNVPKKNEKIAAKIVKRMFHPRVKKALGMLFLGLALEIIVSVAFVLTSFIFFQNFKKEALKGNVSNAQTFINNAYRLNMLGNGTMNTVTAVASVFDHGLASSLYQTYSVGVYFVHNIFDDISEISLGSFKIKPAKLTNSIADSVYAYFLLQEQSVIPWQTVSSLGKIISVAQIAPQILGINRETTYLLLFQNNGELRPTGGFIGSVGELRIKNGSIEIQKVQDVYDLDGQLKGHIEPTFIERRFLQPHLYLRESNYNPNFEITASTSAFLYSLEAHKKVDGVIGLDFEVIKRILQITGPIHLSQESKTITSSNVFDFLQSQIEESKFPGSRVKKDLLNQLMTQIMLTLGNNKYVQLKALALLPELLAQKHILISVENPGINAILAANGFTGNLIDTRIQTEGNMYDVFGINEANIGVNKANIHITRSVKYFVSVGANKKSVRASVYFNNTGDKDYKAYIRFLTPTGAVINKILINNIEQKQVNAVTDPAIYEAKNFKAPAGLEVGREIQDGKQFTGFLIVVPARSKQDIIVSYDSQINLTSAKVLYSLLYLVQPGTNSYPLSIQLEGDNSYIPQVGQNITVSGNTAAWNGNTNGDQDYRFTLIKL